MMCSCSHLYNFVLLKNSIPVTKKSRAAMTMISNCQWTICVVGGGALRIIIIICPNFYICWEKLILSNPNTKPSEDAPSPCIYTPSLCTFINLRKKQVDIKRTHLNQNNQQIVCTRWPENHSSFYLSSQVQFCNKLVIFSSCYIGKLPSGLFVQMGSSGQKEKSEH
jgi:hypothetical protein